MLIGIAAQMGIFAAYIISLLFGFSATDAGAIAIIGSADGPTSIFLSSRLAPHLMGAIAISAYSYMALVPVIQPPFMKLLTNHKERVIRMKPPRVVSPREKLYFAIICLILTCCVVPAGMPLLGMLFAGNILKECGVTKRLADTAAGAFTDILTILIGFTMGASTQATSFITWSSLFIFGVGAIAFSTATVTGILFVKAMNLFLKDDNKINPLIGNAGVSALPDSARVSQIMGLRYDKSNHLLMHAMGPTVASTIGSAVVAGIMLSFLGR
jgi:oxaloacetate decarboxylase beta subunit